MIDQAHTWGAGIDGKCQKCPNPIATGDRYRTVQGGTAHETCKPRLTIVRNPLNPPAEGEQ